MEHSPNVPADACDLRRRHSFALPASCYEVVEITAPTQLAQLRWDDHTLILGEGTNTVFLEPYQGRVLVNCLQGISINEEEAGYQVVVQGGENWHKLVLYLNRQGIYGLENLALIPGTVGAAPVQNIGAYGVEVAQFITAVAGWNLKTQQEFLYLQAACEFGYRSSVFKQKQWQHLFITSVHFYFPKKWQAVLNYKELQSLPADCSAAEVMQRVVEVRQAKLPDPKQLANAGSFFKNPTVSATQAQRLLQHYPELPCYPQADGQVKLAAAWLIEQAGLKGAQQGEAAVHRQQALVLVNKGQASGKDVHQLAKQIQTTVFTRYQVMLEPEVRLMTRQGLMEQL